MPNVVSKMCCVLFLALCGVVQADTSVTTVSMTGTGSPDLKISTIDYSVSPGAMLEDPTTSSLQLYVAVWRNGKVVLASNSMGKPPYYRLAIDSAAATQLIDTVVSNALTVPQATFPPSSSNVSIAWKVASGQVQGLRADFADVQRLQRGFTSGYYSEAAIHVYHTANWVFDTLPSPQSGTLVNISWDVNQ